MRMEVMGLRGFRVILAAMLATTWAGCGGGASSSGGEAGADALADTSAATPDGSLDTGVTPADGGGVCCPYSARCDCLGGGGWAPSASACVSPTANCAADGMWHFETDSHGCQSVSTGAGPNCCGCSTLDAGHEAGPDARSCPANFCACTCLDGGAGYRPQCDAVLCTSTDPCISGLDADGGWLVCGT